MRTATSIVRTIQALASLTCLVACGADNDVGGSLDTGVEEPLGSTEQDLSAQCGGDDSNALAASLAVAIAKELGRWDVNTDFTISNGKLELSGTGKLHCGTGCSNITALLRLQDDASSVITNHSPATYRSKLTGWYTKQKSTLDNLVVNTMLNVDKGVYRIRSASSGKYIVPAGGSISSGAALQQSDQYSASAASQWRVILKGTAHQLINVKSGMCADLTSNATTTGMGLVQRSCNGSSTQAYRFNGKDGKYTIRTGNAPGALNQTPAVLVLNASTANGASIAQGGFSASSESQKWFFEPYGTGVHEDLTALARAVYTIKAEHSGMNIGVSSGSIADGATVVQQIYASTDDRFHWYLTPSATSGATTRYQLINRRTGRCLDLADPNNAGSKLIQRACSTAYSQTFFFNSTGEGSHVMWTSLGRTVDVPGGTLSSGAQLASGPSGGGWAPYNRFTFSPITAGEPHRLAYSHTTQDGLCGQYDWFDITQPNGVVLDDPGSSYVQLIFAGGKQTATGADVNPYIGQQVSGDQVAIDPTYGLTDDHSTSSGVCTASCVKISGLNVAGQCCSCNAVTKKFVRSAWSTTTYLCQ
jgi:hypothetical protein